MPNPEHGGTSRGSPPCTIDKTERLLPLTDDIRLVAIIAPAGYGKTTLLSGWIQMLERAHHPVAVLRLPQGIEAAQVPGRLEQCLSPVARSDRQQDERPIRVLLHTAARAGPFTLCIDGLDSLPQSQRDSVLEEVWVGGFTAPMPAGRYLSFRVTNAFQPHVRARNRAQDHCPGLALRRG